MDAMDAAKILQERLEGHEQLCRRVADMLQCTVCSLSHSLLASLPVQEYITTNYDTLFEEALSQAGRPGVSVIPYNPNPDSKTWLLKLHGCVTQPAEIVLTRADYIRFGERRQAMSGIVQALLVTKKMLFVGFSLNDDNFHSGWWRCWRLRVGGTC